MRELENDILKFYLANYNLPLGMGVVFPAYRSMDTETYSLGFRVSETLTRDEGLRMLQKSMELFPCSLLKHIPYYLKIRDILITEEEENKIIGTIRLAVEYPENN